MKKLSIFVFSVFSFFTVFAKTYVDAYEVRMSVQIPRVYNNTTSQGYRKYQTQRLQGIMYFTYKDTDSTVDIQFGSFTNLTQKTSTGKKISYEVFQEEDAMQRFSVVGNNKTRIFNRGTCSLDLIFEPSYSISDIITEDNSLYVKMTSINGKFKSKNGRKILYSMSGRIAGTVGCACSDYGHVSPTRMLGYWGPMQCYVIDVAACEGTWAMKYRYSFCY